jgi:hypothetical protein
MQIRFIVSIMAAIVAQTLSAWGSEPEQYFPEGAGKSIAVAECGRCHGLEQVLVGHSSEGWTMIIQMMEAFGMKLTPNQIAVVTDYLTKNFPERTPPPPTSFPQPTGSISLQTVCDQRGVCCLGEREGCFGAGETGLEVR